MATYNDREILNSIFNPLLPMGGLLIDENVMEDLKDLAEVEVNTPEGEAAKQLEIQGIRAAEKEQFDNAVDLFTKSINACPTRASGYNNRAQAYRLLGQVENAKMDLHNAINLSNGKGRAACQAYCQRGLINLKENHTDEAKADFETAAKLGSQFAKAQLVQMNPYAALCNKMLKQVFVKLQNGEAMECCDEQKSQR